QLIDPGIGHDRPVIPRENPAFEQQGPVMVIRDHEGLRQDGAIDRRGVQARPPERFSLHAAGAGAEPGMGPPIFPWRTATICDRMASAVSSAVCAPKSSPIGACTLASSAGLTPASVRRATRSRWVFLLPMAPMYRGRPFSAAVIVGSSNFGSWVRIPERAIATNRTLVFEEFRRSGIGGREQLTGARPGADIGL